MIRYLSKEEEEVLKTKIEKKSEKDEIRRNLAQAQKHEGEGNFVWAARYYSYAGYVEKSKEYFIKSAERYLEDDRFIAAALEYEYAGKIEKAKECFIKSAERELDKGDFWYAADHYRKGGEMEKYKEAMEKLRKSGE